MKKWHWVGLTGVGLLGVLWLLGHLWTWGMLAIGAVVGWYACELKYWWKRRRDNRGRKA